MGRLWRGHSKLCKPRGGRRVMLAAGLAVALGGCATTGPKQVTEILWPAPPQTPRIKFEGFLRNEDDLRGLHAERGGTGWLAEALLGRKKPANSFQQPMGVALSHDGARLYVSDYARPGVMVLDFKMRQINPLGGEAVDFKSPFGVAVDAVDNVYVVDSTAKLIRVFNSRGEPIRVITHKSLERPTGIAVDSTRHRIYVADSSNVTSRNQAIRVFDEAGHYLQVFGAPADTEHPSLFPTYLTLDGQGNLYATDTLNAKVEVFAPDGRHVRTIGERGDAFGMFDKPKGVALDSFGNVYVVDSAWSNVQIFNEWGQVLLFFGGRGYVPGLLFNPAGIAIDRDNRIYVADAFNGRVSIYQLINTKAEDSLGVPGQPVSAAGQGASGNSTALPVDTTGSPASGANP